MAQIDPPLCFIHLLSKPRASVGKHTAKRDRNFQRRKTKTLPEKFNIGFLWFVGCPFFSGRLGTNSQHPKMLAQFFGRVVSDLAAEHRRKLALWMNSHHRKEALEQISSALKLKFLEFMKLYGKTGFPPELYVSTKGGAKTSSTSFKETKGTTCGTMGRSTTSFKEDEIQDDLDVLSSSSSSDESEGQDISDFQLGPLELKEEEQRSNEIDETESSGPSEMAALEDLMVEEPEGDGPPKKRGYGCTGMKGVSRRIDTKNGTVSYQARPVFLLGNSCAAARFIEVPGVRCVEIFQEPICCVTMLCQHGPPWVGWWYPPDFFLGHQGLAILVHPSTCLIVHLVLKVDGATPLPSSVA